MRADAVALREAKERLELLGARVALEVEPEADRRKSDRGVPVNRHRPTKVRSPSACTEPETETLERGGDGAQRHSGAGDERLQALSPKRECSVPTARGMQPCFGEGASGLDRARDPRIEGARRLQGNQHQRWIVT